MAETDLLHGFYNHVRLSGSQYVDSVLDDKDAPLRTALKSSNGLEVLRVLGAVNALTVEQIRRLLN